MGILTLTKMVIHTVYDQPTYVFKLFGGTFSWMSRIQSVIALSTIEAQYMEITHVSKEAIWLQRLCSNIGYKQKVVRTDYDIQSIVILEKDPIYHSITKHIDV